MRFEIKKVGINGEGIGYYNRKPVFIDGCWPNEIVEAKIVKQTNNYYKAELLRVIKYSKDRIKPLCNKQSVCGGCPLMSIDYSKQLVIKKDLLQEALHKYCGYKGKIEDVIENPNPLHYRNKINIPFVSVKGKLENAMYKTGTNKPVIIEECVIHEKQLEQIRKEVLTVLNNHKCVSYNHSNKEGFRQLVVRGFKEYQIVLITGNQTIDEKIVQELSYIKGVTSIYQGINTKKNPINMMGDKLISLYGNSDIELEIFSRKFNLTPQSFFQLNTDQTVSLYSKVIELVDDDNKLIVEAYCGIGIIGSILSEKAEKVIGIEINPSAIADGKKYAKLNGIENLEFICGDAGKELEKLISNNEIDVLVVDPPRTGLDDNLVKQLNSSYIKKIVYVSCNPATLAKNLKGLSHYKINTVQPYDMFSQTPHVETVVLLSRK